MLSRLISLRVMGFSVRRVTGLDKILHSHRTEHSPFDIRLVFLWANQESSLSVQLGAGCKWRVHSPHSWPEVGRVREWTRIDRRKPATSGWLPDLGCESERKPCCQ